MYMPSGDINPGEQSPEGIYIWQMHISAAIQEQISGLPCGR